jgi:hypothetical protein
MHREECAAYPIPMCVNAALRDPFKDQDPHDYSSGGPTWNVLDIWKAAAPSIDVIGPDIYLRDYRSYIRTLDLYTRIRPELDSSARSRAPSLS